MEGLAALGPTNNLDQKRPARSGILQASRRTKSAGFAPSSVSADAGCTDP
jgi:hypothetical protein